jgi:alkanesulfonate monooxygenase SsuD/methylene tetrahydromethanopterin reductase-like flavin-dependent oxidoreductase (luciferase family)
MTAVGVSLLPDARDPAALLELAVLADELGFEYLAVQDHPYQPGFLDALSLLAVILGRTRRIRVLPDVAVQPLRPPAMLAKAAASLDRISGGRFVLGVGAGGYLEAIGQMGGPALTRRRSLDAFAEALAVTRGLWDAGGAPFTFAGEHHRVDGLAFGPPPSAALELWVGAHGPRMLQLIAAHADGWVPSLFRGRTVDDLAAAGRRLDEAAVAAGRSPSDIRRVWNVPLRIDARTTDGGAPAEVWAQRMTAWRDERGATDFIVWPGGPDAAAQLEAFAADVRPLLDRSR